jgi:Holliday junction resolvase RusA-like endonuclease
MVIARRPSSHKSGGRKAYQEALTRDAQRRFAGRPILGGRLYVRVVWFHREWLEGQQADVDNISKPILDALIGVVYPDDKRVVQRLAARVDLKADYAIEASGVDPGVLEEFLAALDAEADHVLYIEVGELEGVQRIVFGPIDGGGG